MSFLKNLFKKKPGGTFFGKLLRGATSMIPVVGGAVSGFFGNGSAPESAPPLTTFAGQPAQLLPNNTYAMANMLPQVTVNSTSPLEKLAEKLGEVLKPAVTKATEGVKVGADNSTKWVIAGAASFIALALIISSKK